MDIEFFLNGCDIYGAFEQARREVTKRFLDESKFQVTLVSVSMAWVQRDGQALDRYWIYKFVGGPR